jgi:16S rRNA (guanine527-N7)-methyltransferase
LQASELLLKGFKTLGLDLTGVQADAFGAYLHELKRWGRAYSLTSLKTDEDIIVKHFIDSCLYLKALPADVHSVADVGSGAGLPGLPLKIMRPELEVFLIESSSKKSSFLRHMLRTLKLEGIECIEGRVEDIKDIEVDAVLTRALFSVGDFIKKAGHIVRPGGIFVLSKGPKVEGELEGAAFEYETMEIGLPLTDIKRTLVMVRKQ